MRRFNIIEPQMFTSLNYYLMKGCNKYVSLSYGRYEYEDLVGDLCNSWLVALSASLDWVPHKKA